ncbi:tetratricopeptide repeat protein [Lentimicrobium sp. L6]|uniref:tetratricopeptide repeat protein n=1 Tax=Lentimicrobium sp. L6 TaxID=2735916 RepID=UPI0015547F7D|nr:tetratricopeptide repeat protein [Lentimicrobium sp. L6]NPD84171.1 tetratricopeptide repeat protein [Lentimicrobium sp. L6]
MRKIEVENIFKGRFAKSASRKTTLGMNKYWIILLLILFCSNHLSAQVDSILFNAEHPDVYVETLVKKARKEFDNNTRTSYFYLEEALKLDEYIHDTTKIELYNVAGELHFMLNLFDLSFDYLHQALEIQNRIDSLGSFAIYNRIGTVYLIMKDYEKARYNYLKAKDLYERHPAPEDIDENKIHAIINNLSVLERDEGNFFKSKNYLNQYLDKTIAAHDTTHIIFFYHNLSIVYFDLEEYKEGMIYLNKAIELCYLANSNRELSLLLKNKGEVFHTHNNSNDSAIYYTLKAYDLGKEIGHPHVQKEAVRLLYTIYKSIGEFEKALEYKEIEQRLSEEAINTENIKKVTSIELNAKYKQSRRELIEKQKKNELILYTILIGLIIIALFFLMLFRLQKTKATKRKLQNEILRSTLESKNKEFTAKLLHTLQITELLNDTHNRILSIREDGSDEMRKNLTSILTSIKQEHFSFNWEEFEKLFVETHQDFYTNLLSDFPNLTKNELRLCAFLKMNLSSKEISAITNQSYRSIVVARSRMRKKLGIETEQQSITSFLAGY